MMYLEIDRTSCPLKLICHIKDVFLDICTSRSLPMISEAKLNNVDKQTKGLMGFEPHSRTIHSITRQRQYDHDYCAPAFSQVNLLLRVVTG